jgi:hypothetical protein
MVAARIRILRIAPLGGESEQRFFAFFALRFRKDTVILTQLLARIRFFAFVDRRLSV